MPYTQGNLRWPGWRMWELSADEREAEMHSHLGQSPRLRAPGESRPIAKQRSVVAIHAVPDQPYRLGYIVRCEDGLPSPGGGPTVFSPPVVPPPQPSPIVSTDGFQINVADIPTGTISAGNIRIERQPDGSIRFVYGKSASFFDQISDWLNRDSLVSSIQNKYLVGGVLLAIFLRRR